MAPNLPTQSSDDDEIALAALAAPPFVSLSLFTRRAAQKQPDCYACFTRHCGVLWGRGVLLRLANYLHSTHLDQASRGCFAHWRLCRRLASAVAMESRRQADQADRVSVALQAGKRRAAKPFSSRLLPFLPYF